MYSSYVTCCGGRRFAFSKMLYNSILLDAKTAESIYSLYINNKDYDINSLHKNGNYVTTYSILMDLCKQVITDDRVDMIFAVLERDDLDINLVNNANHSALHYLMGEIQYKNNQIVLSKFLTRHDVETSNAISAYIKGCGRQFFDIKTLRNMLAQCKNFIPDNEGNTIAHIIALYRPMLLHELREYANGIDINLKNNRGETVLMILLRYSSNIKLLKMLTNTFPNVNYNICNSSGKTRIELFFQLYSTKVISIPLYLIKMGCHLDYRHFPDDHFSSKRYRMRRKILMNVIKQRILVRNCLRKWAKNTMKKVDCT